MARRHVLVITLGTLVLGVFIGVYAHAFITHLDKATEADDLKSELQLEKKMLAACRASIGSALDGCDHRL
jgi:NhaP-type Na+/H+ or K+/H+ antiporter